MATHHLTDVAAYILGATGVAVAMSPPDYAALGVAALGGIIGGFLSVAIMPEPPVRNPTPEKPDKRRRSVAAKWAVSTLTSISITPFLFQRWAQPVAEAGEAVRAGILPNSAEAMLALSTAVAFLAWGTLFLLQVAWRKWISNKIKDEIGE